MKRRLRRASVLGLVAGLMLASTFLTPTRGSVMSGVQQVVTPAVQAQYFNGMMCDQAFSILGEWEFQGWGHAIINWSHYIGPIFYGYDVYEYGGTWTQDGTTSPFSFQCLVYWF